jgi:hypothetical protein
VTATRYTEDTCEIEAQVPDSIRRRLEQYVVVKRTRRKAAAPKTKKTPTK